MDCNDSWNVCVKVDATGMETLIPVQDMALYYQPPKAQVSLIYFFIILVITLI